MVISLCRGLSGRHALPLFLTILGLTACDAQTTNAPTNTAPPGNTPPANVAQMTCAMRDNLAANPNLRWADLRAACDDAQAAYKQKDPVGYNWFINAGNGFTGFPYIVQRILPDLAPEIWGRPEESFGRFGLIADPNPKRPLPMGLGIRRAPAVRSTPIMSRPAKSTSPSLVSTSSRWPAAPAIPAACASTAASRFSTARPTRRSMCANGARPTA
ncbi:MAG: hypothetical protein WDN48_18905 [Pseudolabrys sp.]